MVLVTCIFNIDFLKLDAKMMNSRPRHLRCHSMVAKQYNIYGPIKLMYIFLNADCKRRVPRINKRETLRNNNNNNNNNNLLLFLSIYLYALMDILCMCARKRLKIKEKTG